MQCFDEKTESNIETEGRTITVTYKIINSKWIFPFLTCNLKALSALTKDGLRPLD